VRAVKRVSCISAVLAAGLAGCAEKYKMEVAPVTGKVTCNGKPITEGYIIFTPIVSGSADPAKSGKSAYATIKPDGTYSLTTYDEGDGALIGKHEVRIYKPDPEDDEQIVVNRFACSRRVLEVTVEEKDNVIDLDPARG
jgi:hypothetical protein